MLQRGEAGADTIIDFIKYYRGNHFIINQIEAMFKEESVMIRKQLLYKILFPHKYKILRANHGSDSNVLKEINDKYSLFDLLSFLCKIQDFVKGCKTAESANISEYQGYDIWMNEVQELIRKGYNLNKDYSHKGYYFYNVIFPPLFC